MRDAENGEAFLGEVEWSYGFATRLLSGDEEAELTRRGVGETGARTLLLDVGGGSTELIISRVRTSLDIGSVRLTERFGDDLVAAEAHVRALLPDLEVDSAVGVAGTVAQLALLCDLTRDGIDATVSKLAAMPLEQRRAVPGMDPDRAPVIVAGALIVRTALDRYGLSRIEYSVRDLLDGAALEAAELPVPAEGDAPPGAYTCC